jgi:hypothetical protein
MKDMLNITYESLNTTSLDKIVNNTPSLSEINTLSGEDSVNNTTQSLTTWPDGLNISSVIYNDSLGTTSSPDIGSTIQTDNFITNGELLEIHHNYSRRTDTYFSTDSSQNLLKTTLQSHDLSTSPSNHIVSYNNHASTVINHTEMDQIIQTTSSQW